MKSYFDLLYQNVFAFIAVASLLAMSISMWVARRERAQGARYRVEYPTLLQPTAGNIVFFALLAMGCAAWFYIVMWPLDFGHRDEIALLTQPIVPTMYSMRFFPLGHMEFAMLPLGENGRLGALYYLPLLQLVAVCILIDRIIQPAGTFVRIYALCASLALALIIPFTNVIIPERNAIFFMVAALYFFRCYRNCPRLLSAAACVLCISVSLYYKEPMFLLWLGFAFGLLGPDAIRWVSHSKICDDRLYPPGQFRAIATGTIVASIFFVIGYLFFVFYNGTLGEAYTFHSSQSLMARIMDYIVVLPFLPVLLLIAGGAHLIMPYGDGDRVFLVSISLAAAGYAAALVVLKLPLNGYYFSPLILLIILGSAMLFKHIDRTSMRIAETEIDRPFGKIPPMLIGGALLLGLLLIGKPVFHEVHRDTVSKMNYQAEYDFLRTSLRDAGDIRTIYYVPRTYHFNDYATGVLMLFTHATGIDRKFHIFSESGCNMWMQTYDNGAIRCSQKQFHATDPYDVLVVENHRLAEIDPLIYRSKTFVAPFVPAGGSRPFAGPVAQVDYSRPSITVAVRRSRAH